jgi:hypothetical protein
VQAELLDSLVSGGTIGATRPIPAIGSWRAPCTKDRPLKNCGGLWLVTVSESVAMPSHPTMVDQIPPVPQDGLEEWKKRALLDQLKADFPHVAEDVLEHAVDQAAALLGPGMNLVALFASASMLVRDSSK